MSQWLAHLVDAVMLLTVAEYFALRAFHRRTTKGVNPQDIGLNIFSGLSLMLALRSALSGWDPVFIPLFLVLAGTFHGLDIRSRWRR